MGFQFVKKDISDYLVNGFNKQYLLKRMTRYSIRQMYYRVCPLGIVPHYATYERRPEIQVTDNLRYE